jgi:triosephosphate isomerase
MARRKIVAGNWKMNKVYDEAIGLTEELLEDLDREKVGDTHIIIAPPFVHLQPITELLMFTPGIAVAAQNCHQEANGAYTGEVSAEMIKSVDADAVILGHSERREYFGETDELISKKIRAVLNQDMSVIYCCGETLEQRKAGDQEKVVGGQIREALSDFSTTEMASIIIAYEPIWAIGTGETASVEQAGAMHAFIRGLVAELFDSTVADQVSILYGGSVKPSNANELFSHPDIDGGLVGGASLKSEDLINIIYAMPK